MHFDQTPDRPVPPHGNSRSGGQGPGSASPRPGYRGTGRPWPGDQEPPAPRSYRPRPGRPAPSDQETDNRETGRPWPESGQAPYRPVPGDLRRRGPAGPGGLRPTRPQDPWDADPTGPRFSGQQDPWSKDPWSKDPWSTEANDPWSAESRGPWATEARGLQSAGPGDPRTAAPPPGQPQPVSPKRESPLKLTGSLLRAKSMRKPVMVSGALGVVLVLAIGMVALAVTRGSSNGSAASAGTQASNLTKASRTAPATTKASAKDKASAKPTPSHTAKKTTAASGKTAPALLTVPSGWKLAFDPSFSGSQLSTATWSTCYDWATPSVGCTNNPAAEKEWYIPSQVNVSGGTLNLVATQETTQGRDTSGAPKTFTCRSGMVSSKPGFNFTYGLIQISAKLPYGPGLWPALWLAATNDQWPPELDIVEHWYSQPQAKVYDHTVGRQYLGGPVPTPADLSAGFHTYSLLWTKDRVTWYLDGAQVFTTTSYVPQQAMYFIANVADDSTAKGACTGTMEIQSVKVWQP